jgi:hypothetical protein
LHLGRALVISPPSGSARTLEFGAIIQGAEIKQRQQ